MLSSPVTHSSGFFCADVFCCSLTSRFLFATSASVISVVAKTEQDVCRTNTEKTSSGPALKTIVQLHEAVVEALDALELHRYVPMTPRNERNAIADE